MAAPPAGQPRERPPVEASSAPPPNVLLIVSDAHRRDVLPFYGGPATTPHLEALARAGTVFDSAYATAPYTMPSSVSLLTGEHHGGFPVHRRALGTETDGETDHEPVIWVGESEQLLAEVLAGRGYEVVRDVENPQVERTQALQGFTALPAPADLPPGARGEVRRATGLSLEGRKPACAARRLRLLQSSLHFLLREPGDPPFFALKWFADPHTLYCIESSRRADLVPADDRLPHDRRFYEALHFGQHRARGERTFTDDEGARFRSLYRSEVESVDERVGFLLAALEAAGQRERTFIVFTADHGELFGEHGLWGHAFWYYEDLLRVPLVVVGPGVPAGLRVPDRVSLEELMPTLADLLDAPWSGGGTGRSFAALLTGAELPPREVSYFSARRASEGDAVRVGDWKLLHRPPHGSRAETVELYDLGADPDENVDLSRRKPERVQRLRAELEQQRAERMRRSSLRARGGPGGALVPETAEMMDGLRALGYVE